MWQCVWKTTTSCGLGVLRFKRFVLFPLVFFLVIVIVQLFPCWASPTSALWRRPLQVGQVFPLCAFPTSSRRSHHIASSNHPINPVQDIFVYHFLTMPFTTRMSLPSLFWHNMKKTYLAFTVFTSTTGGVPVPVQKKNIFSERQDTEDLSKLCGSTSLVVAVVPYTSPFPSAPPMVSILDLTAWFPEVRFTAIPVTCLRRIA